MYSSQGETLTNNAQKTDQSLAPSQQLPDQQSALTITLYNTADEPYIIPLITGIQLSEHGAPDVGEELDDLQSIEATYMRGTGGFWVARVAAQGPGTIVGTAAIKDVGQGDVMMKRMYVLPAYRGSQPFGVANALMAAVVEWARQKGIRAIYLGTDTATPRPIRFYSRSGFQRITREAVPARAPVSQYDNVFMKLELC